jgi:DNA mismatch repair ATPase MutS
MLKKDGKNANNTKTINSIKIGNYTIEPKDIKFTQLKESKWEIDIIYLKTSNGTLKANIDKMGRIVKEEFVKWIHEKIISNSEVLNALNTFARFIGEIDLLQSNTLNAVEKGYVSPRIDIDDNKNLNKNIKSFIKVDKIRHPIIEHITTNAKYVPNDVVMGSECTDGMLLFGVNAVGKSSLMKSIGINVIMAQAGMYVAASKFEYKPYKYLFTRIRNNDNLYAGLSSFEVEMKEFKIILKYANEDSIILGDELCSGTNSQDATALVAAGVGILSKRKCSFIFATHLHSLSTMSEITKLSNVKLFHMLVEKDPKDPKKLIYSRKIQSGSGPNSYGILVCESMNLDDEFIMKAKEIRASMNSETQSYTEIATLGSKYNTNKVIAMCEVCSNHIATDVHHINQQCDANQNGIINDMENGIFNKNKLWNLVSLCKECHIGVHNVPSKLEIGGYIKTSNGVELQYKWVELERCDCESETDPIGEENDNNFDNKLEVETPKPEVIIIEKEKEKDNKIKKSDKEGKVEKKGLESITEEIKEIIMKMKMANYTPKKIQFDLKRNHNIELTQQQVRNFE